MNDELEINGLIKVLFWHLLAEPQGNHEEPQSGQPLPRLRFEPSTSRIQVQSRWNGVYNSMVHGYQRFGGIC
jgi:hypothetical protein